MNGEGGIPQALVPGIVEKRVTFWLSAGYGRFREASQDDKCWHLPSLQDVMWQKSGTPPWARHLHETTGPERLTSTLPCRSKCTVRPGRLSVKASVRSPWRGGVLDGFWPLPYAGRPARMRAAPHTAPSLKYPCRTISPASHPECFARDCERRLKTVALGRFRRSVEKRGPLAGLGGQS